MRGAMERVLEQHALGNIDLDRMTGSDLLRLLVATDVAMEQEQDEILAEAWNEVMESSMDYGD